MTRLLAAFCLAAVALTARTVSAEDHAPVVRGTQGLVEVPFRADNEGPGRMECKAALAHWYSFDLGRAGPGASLRATLWSDPRDGNVFLLNALEDHMPVQMLWCGAGPEDWAGRAVIRLERKAGEAQAPIHVKCRQEGRRLECRP